MNWEQPKRAEADYARLLFEITKKAFRIPLALRAEFLDLWSHQAAERMVLQRLHETARTWRAASREVMRGQYIYELLQRELDGPIGVRVNELIAENAKLIRSLPEKVALQAAQEQARRAQEGMRPEVDKNLLGHIAHWHSRLIARTETAKAQSALTQARAEELDLTYYVWRTSRRSKSSSIPTGKWRACSSDGAILRRRKRSLAKKLRAIYKPDQYLQLPVL